jgi:SNF2 family DNA or RNA helicase
LPHVFVCRKCGKTYTEEEFAREKFCRVDGTFLTPKPVQTRLTETTGQQRRIHTEPSLRHLNVPLRRSASNEIKRRKQETAGDEPNEQVILKPIPCISYIDPHNIRKLIEKEQYSSFEKFTLNLKAQEIKKIGAIDKLISMDMLRARIDAHPYQMKVALSVLQEMNTNAILADEVGLGKTIEAGIIMKELLLRGMVNSVLIIVPRAFCPNGNEKWRKSLARDLSLQVTKRNSSTLMRTTE